MRWGLAGLIPGLRNEPVVAGACTVPNAPVIPFQLDLRNAAA